MTSRQLVIDNVGKRFSGAWVLRNICARIHPGQITAFIGPNGAGKTTLFHVITGDYFPDEGHVFLDRREITGWSPWKLARLGIGRQFQEARVFGGLSVMDNVIVALMSPEEQSPRHFWRHFWRRTPRRNPRTETALQWLETVGLQDQGDTLSRELSFGQQKLLALARLLANGTDLLLLDEPTAGLSHGMIDQVMAVLRRLAITKGITVILIEHNMTVVASLADWIYFVDQGRIAFNGRADHVLGNEDVRQMYMGL